MANDKAIITQAAQKYGIDPKVLWGLYGTETTFGKNVSISSAGAVGPFQFLPGTAKSLGVNPYDFKSAAYGAAKYLSQYKARGVGGMLSAYNAGPAGGYQSGYVNTTLANARTYGGASGSIPIAASVGPSAVTGGAQASSLPSFNQAGFQQAEKRAIVGKLLRSEKGGSENPLLLTGLATTKLPQRSEYESETGAQATGQSGGAGAGVETAGQHLPQAPPNLTRPATPPVKVSLPSYITGKGYPAVEKAKTALERAEHHPVGIPELRRQVGEGANAPHAEIVAHAPTGVVVRQQGKPVFLPHKRTIRQ